MSITRRVIFFGLALVPLLLLAACGGDDDDSGEAFQLLPPGEYSLEVTGTMEIEIVPEEVSAAPRALGQPETSDVSGNLTIQLGENGLFTIKAGGANLVAGNLQGGPVTLYQSEVKPSTGTVSNDGIPHRFAGVCMNCHKIVEFGPTPMNRQNLSELKIGRQQRDLLLSGQSVDKK